MAGIEFADLNWVAIGASMLANIVLGFIWYAPQSPTGKTWMREMKMPLNAKPDPKEMGKSMGLMLVGAFLMMFVLAHFMVGFRDAFRLDGVATLGLMGGVTAGFLVWLGFMAPLSLNAVAFERRSWTLFGINAGYYLLTMLIAGAIFGSML